MNADNVDAGRADAARPGDGRADAGRVDAAHVEGTPLPAGPGGAGTVAEGQIQASDVRRAQNWVQQDMFTVLHGQPAPVVTRWSYRADDPLAVTLGVRTRRERWVEWLVSRDLVADSLNGPTGIGDIRMSPQEVQGYDIVEIEIRSSDGRAVLEVDRDLLAQFVGATEAIVARGQETAHLDLEAMITRLSC